MPALLQMRDYLRAIRKRNWRKGNGAMKKSMLYLIGILLLFYMLICLLLYFFQERFIFFPEKLRKDERFSFRQPFSEVSIRAGDNTALHALHFKADSAKGVIFYLHGNAGSLRGWGGEAAVYTRLGYDVFMPDYRSYGKSEGAISSEEQLSQDMQAAYRKLKESYAEEEIVVLGYSIGTGPAVRLAATNRPSLLILQAPYYSLVDVMRQHYPIVPTFLLKYRFEIYKWIQRCSMPVVLFHGNRDEIISYQSSVKLKALLKKEDKLITLEGGTHNGMSSHPAYLIEIEKVLAK
jgi:uncharacterized protein